MIRSSHPGLLGTLILAAHLFILVGCAAPQVSQASIQVAVQADGKTNTVQLPAGSTVDEALKARGIILGPLDRTEPPLYTVLGDGSQARVVRVAEEFIVQEEVVPFESQVLRNESLPAGQEYWLQLGKNGLVEITIRKVFEDGEEVSSNPVKSVVVQEALPQIKMVGVQKPFAPFAIPGRIAYLVDGNAWVMEVNTANRRQVVNSGDLDGRVFSISPDREWLLFTRGSEEEGVINSLWAVPLAEGGGEAIDLGVANVVHFADWRPGAGLTLAYSTVEPRPGPPGWQANNDLQMATFSPSGFVDEPQGILEANSGGLYGWWGTSFAWAPDGSALAYARPDGVGLVSLEDGQQAPLQEFAPLQTFGDWAWVPGIGWGPDGRYLFSVEAGSQIEAQTFDLSAIEISGKGTIRLIPGVGMFAYPLPSPPADLPSGEHTYRVAYLQAMSPAQSDTSRYRLFVMDRDGSNRQALFPPEGAGGLEAQKVGWSPEAFEQGPDSASSDIRAYALAVIYEKNLWLVNSLTGEALQITGDGLTSKVDWK